MSGPLLALNALTVGYGERPALSDITLEIHAGEAVALLGANGAGKSTLLKTVMGFLGPQRGGLRLAGQALERLSVERRARLGIGYCPEGRRVFPGMTVRENLEVAARVGQATRRTRLDTVFALFPQLVARSGTRAWQLSGGQQQMLAIGRALMGAPRLLLLDEPSLGLSPRLTIELLAAVRAIADTGTAVLLAEQNAAQSLAVCDRAYLLELGRVRWTGPADRLAARAELREAFLGG